MNDKKDAIIRLEPVFSRLKIIERNIKFSLRRNQNIYHYTDYNAFCSIIENKEFWATNIYYMNDKNEYQHGLRLFERCLVRKMQNASEPEGKIYAEALSHIDDIVSGEIFPLSSRNVFALSFSYNKDSLLMWKMYGGEFGISMDFDWNQCHEDPGMRLIRKELYEKEENAGIKKSEIFFPYSVVYDDKKKEELVEYSIETIMDVYRHLSFESYIEGCVTDLVDQFFLVSPLLKDRKFEGEGECRFIEQGVPRQGEDFCIKYRKRRGEDVPYIKFNVLDGYGHPIQEWPIREIMVGPGEQQEKTTKKVKAFLADHHLQYLADKVKPSSL